MNRITTTDPYRVYISTCFLSQFFFTFRASGTSKGHVKINEDEVIHVNVIWGHLEESFELHNKSK